MKLKLDKTFYICIAVFLLFIITSRWIFKKETYNSQVSSSLSSSMKEIPISFLTKEQASDFLQSDPDDYAKQFNPINLFAIGRSSIQDLLSRWSSSTDSFTEEEKKKLKEAISLVQRSINDNIKDKSFKNQLLSLKWQLAKTIYPYYVDGLSHTREDIIWLSDKTLSNISISRLAKLLLHELTHIWERYFPNQMNAWMEKQGFTEVGLLKDDPYYRCNPDLNGKQYKDKNGDILFARFTTTSPSNLMDVQFSNGQAKFEHPYEQLAYKMEQFITT